MYKKTLMLLSFIALLFIGAVSVRAYECEYKNDNYEITINYDEETGKASLVSLGNGYGYNKNDLEKYNITDDIHMGLCPDYLIVDKFSHADEGDSIKFCSTESDSDCPSGFWSGGTIDAIPYIGERDTFNKSCPQTGKLKLNFQNAIDEYSACEDAVCKSKKISDVNSSEDTLKNYCKNIVSSYTHGNTDESECMKECFAIDDVIKTSKINAGIENYGTSACGFSDKLLAFISNIMRWMKYILPAIVILLGIIDFIKAIAASKDDEMKKAQGRFIKRLIAAALVFIIPLIIEFVLDIMGFGYNSCDIF